jgi:hypothetical protein
VIVQVRCCPSTMRRVVAMRADPPAFAGEGRVGKESSPNVAAASAGKTPWAKMPHSRYSLANALRTKGLGCGGRPGRRTDPRWPTLARSRLAESGNSAIGVPPGRCRWPTEQRACSGWRSRGDVDGLMLGRPWKWLDSMNTPYNHRSQGVSHLACGRPAALLDTLAWPNPTSWHTPREGAGWHRTALGKLDRRRSAYGLRMPKPPVRKCGVRLGLSRHVPTHRRPQSFG